LVVRPTLALATVLARFDDAVIDRGVDGVAAVTGAAARAAAAGDDRGVDAAVSGVASRVRALGSLARRPQTGQLHQYYLQAAAVLAAGTILLVLMR
ncbi:MAG: NADH-quinone oxidoreductase subunit L, partial [Actinomycetota bacterium]|nr:NADH-quinone oxidoreductase subunit L [Actinomycetota bacterium]